MNRGFLVSAGLALILGTGTPGFAQDEGAQLQAVLDKAVPSMVTVKIVMKTETKFGGQSRDVESRLEVQGIVVDKEGLIMISNAPFSPGRFMGMFGGGGSDEEGGMGVKATPTDFKVLFGQEEKEYGAFLAATDTKLDLAFLKVEDLGDRKLSAVEFINGNSVSIGQKVVTISRLAKGYDYAPYFASGRISGVITKPRKAWMLDGASTDFGMPIYALNGDVLGVLTTLEPGVKSDSGDSSMGFSMMMRMFTGGGSGSALRAFVVPSQTVAGVIVQARAKAISVAAERAKNKGNKGAATPPKKSDTKPAKKP